MQESVDHNELNDALRRCGSSWSAAQVHGLLCSQLTLLGRDAGPPWLDQVLQHTETDNALLMECQSLLGDLFAQTYRRLSERLSEFTPLLPDDSESTGMRAEAISHWAEGFLHGLVSGSHGDELKSRLADEPLSDIIKDLLEITKATVDDEADDNEEDERAWVELSEYLRVVVQIIYEELAVFRDPAEQNFGGPEHPNVLH